MVLTPAKEGGRARTTAHIKINSILYLEEFFTCYQLNTLVYTSVDECMKATFELMTTLNIRQIINLQFLFRPMRDVKTL